MDSICFEGGETLFRPPGEHSFVPGRDGVVSVQDVSFMSRASPRPRCAASIKNLCGRFTTYLQQFLSHVAVSVKNPSACFGRHKTMHHLFGTLTVHCGVAYFKGCPGLRGLVPLSRDLFMDAPVCEVHMGVFKACLGRRVQTAHGCYLERSVRRRFRGVRPLFRLLERTQAVHLKIERFDPAEFPHLSGDAAPTSVDLTVTGNGVLLLRFSWARCVWTADTEAAVLRFCDWIAGELRECC